MSNQNVVYSELVHHIGDCIPNLKDTLEKTIALQSALFFPTMVREREAYAQPIIMPTAIANATMAILLDSERYEEQYFANYVIESFNLMRLNAVSPAPVTFHFRFIQMFETIIVNGLRNNPDEITKLANLQVGDLVIIQIELNENQLVSGLAVISNPLELYMASVGNMVAPNYTVH